MSRFYFEYDNDTGLDDETFWEWWSVFCDRAEICKANSEEWAKQIVDALEAADALKGKK